MKLLPRWLPSSAISDVRVVILASRSCLSAAFRAFASLAASLCRWAFCVSVSLGAPSLLLGLRSGRSRSFFWAWAAKLFRWSRRASSTDTVPFSNIWTIGGDFRLIRLWLVTSAPAFVLFLTLCLPRKLACRNQHNARIISKFKILKWGHS